MNNGVMFVSTPNNQVMALDARTGAVRWRFRVPPGRRRARSRHQSRCRPTEDKQYFASIHAGPLRARCANRKGGVETTVADNSQGIT